MSTRSAHPTRGHGLGAGPALTLSATLGLLAVTTLALPVRAADLQRCLVDGEVWFTDTACPDQTRGQPVVVETPTLGNLEDAKRVRREGDRLWLYKRDRSGRAEEDSADTDLPPARPTSLDILNAIRRRQVLDGMTAEEVREAWGPPTSTTEGSAGGMSWTYRGTDKSGKKHSRKLTFSDGVVDGWTNSRVRVRTRFDPDEGRWLD